MDPEKLYIDSRFTYGKLVPKYADRLPSFKEIVTSNMSQAEQIKAVQTTLKTFYKSLPEAVQKDISKLYPKSTTTSSVNAKASTALKKTTEAASVSAAAKSRSTGKTSTADKTRYNPYKGGDKGSDSPSPLSYASSTAKPGTLVRDILSGKAAPKKDAIVSSSIPVRPVSSSSSSSLKASSSATKASSGSRSSKASTNKSPTLNDITKPARYASFGSKDFANQSPSSSPGGSPLTQLQNSLAKIHRSDSPLSSAKREVQKQKMSKTEAKSKASSVFSESPVYETKTSQSMSNLLSRTSASSVKPSTALSTASSASKLSKSSTFSLQSPVSPPAFSTNLLERLRSTIQSSNSSPSPVIKAMRPASMGRRR